jgi:hypothetical protein
MIREFYPGSRIRIQESKNHYTRIRIHNTAKKPRNALLRKGNHGILISSNHVQMPFLLTHTNTKTQKLYKRLTNISLY